MNLSKNTFIQQGVDTLPDIQPTDREKEKKEKIDKAETETSKKIAQMLSNATGIPVAALPAGLVIGLMTGTPILLTAFGITALGVGVYAAYEGGKIVLKNAGEIGQAVLDLGAEVASVPLKMGAGFVNLGDPDGKGVMNRFLAFLEKRGESHLPKEWKMALDGYEVFVKGVTIPIKGAITIWGYSAVALETLNNFKLDGIAAKEEEVKKDKAELLKLQENSINFEKELNLVLEEERASQLTPVQSQVFAEKANKFFPPGNPNPDIESKNSLYRSVLSQDNLYYRFGLDLAAAEDPVAWTNSLDHRKATNKLLGALFPGVTSGNLETLAKIYFFLNGNNESLNLGQIDEFNKAINTHLSAFGIHNLDELRADAFFTEFLANEVLLISRRSTNKDTYNAEIERLNIMVEMVEQEIHHPNFLSMYKDTWLAGAAVSMGGRDVFDPRHTSDKATFFRWITTPDAPAIDAEIVRIRAVNSNFGPANSADFDAKLSALNGRPAADIENSLNKITSLNPRTTENFIAVSNSIAAGLVTNPGLKAELKNAVNIFASGTTLQIDDLKLAQAISNPGTSVELNALLVLLQPLVSPIPDTELIRLINSYCNGADDPISIYMATSPYFEGLYECYGGNLKSFYADFVNSAGVYNPLFTGLNGTLTVFETELNNLRTEVTTNPGALRALRNTYFEDIVRGNILIEENLLVGRDHLGYLEDLANQLTAARLIAAPADLLVLVPDIDMAVGGMVTPADLDPASPLVVMLKYLGKMVFERYIKETDSAERARLTTLTLPLNMLGIEGTLVRGTKDTVDVDFNLSALMKYLNGYRVGMKQQNASNIIAKHPFGYEV